MISRLKARKGDDYYDADVGIYRKMKQIYEPVKEKERHIVVDTTLDPRVNTEEIKNRIFGEKHRNE